MLRGEPRRPQLEPSRLLCVLLNVPACSVMNRHRFDTDPYPDPTFNFNADPEPDLSATLIFIHVGKS